MSAYTQDMDVLDALTAEHRCDRCQAQARAVVQLASGGELHFCLHHVKNHRDALEKIEARVWVEHLDGTKEVPAEFAVAGAGAEPN